MGFIAFFAPWVDMSSPEIRLLSRADPGAAQRVGVGAGVAWFVLFPMMLSRRSIDQMQGHASRRHFFRSCPVVTVSILWFLPPHARYVPIRFEWGWEISTPRWGIGLIAHHRFDRLGGRIDDIRVSRGALAGRAPTLH